MESEKNTILDIDKITNQSKGILPNASKGKYITYSVDELTALRDKSRFDFAYMIESNKWLDFIYSGDWEHNHRLQFVRLFYYKEWKTKKATNSVRADKQGQLKLL
jgi:hypothetical protein